MPYKIYGFTQSSYPALYLIGYTKLVKIVGLKKIVSHENYTLDKSRTY